MIKVTRWALALLLSMQFGTAWAVTGMRFISTAGDYIGSGSTQTFTEPGATITATATPGGAHVSVNRGNQWWNLDFAAPSGSELVRGGYPAAARYPFQSPMGAGLSVSGDGRGCNTLKGWFRVREYTLDATGGVTSLAIDFLQNCEVTGPPLYGAVRLNSSLPLAVPDLAAIAGADFAVIAGQVAALDGTQSFARRNGPLTYRWTQVDGPAVTLDNPVSATPRFTAPDVSLDGATLRFRLDVTDKAGKTARDHVIVLAENINAPRTQISFHGDTGDYITGGLSYSYNTTNSRIAFSQNFAGGVSASVNGSTWWSLDTATPSGTPFTAGTYLNAQRFPFQDTGAPGLSLYGDGRGCNTLTGSFTVHQVRLDVSGNPEVLDMSFEQHCEGGAPAAYGQVLLNAVPNAKLAPRLRAAHQRYGNE